MTPSKAADYWRKLSYAQIAKLADALAFRLIQWRASGVFGDVKGMETEDAEKLGAWLEEMELELERRRHEHVGASRLPH